MIHRWSTNSRYLVALAIILIYLIGLSCSPTTPTGKLIHPYPTPRPIHPSLPDRWPIPPVPIDVLDDQLIEVPYDSEPYLWKRRRQRGWEEKRYRDDEPGIEMLEGDLILVAPAQIDA